MSYYSIYNPSTSSGNVTVGLPTTATTGYTYTTSATEFNWSNSYANPVTISQNAKIDLKGDGADIVINGQSLNDTLQEIKTALRIPSKLNRDPKLETAWEELQQAADHYEKLLKEYREKQQVWDTLKTQD